MSVKQTVTLHRNVSGYFQNIMAEISVEMRLKLNKLRSDAAKAGQEVRGGLASSVKGLGQTNSEREETARNRAAFREMVIKRRSNNRIEDSYDSKNDAEKAEQGRSNFKEFLKTVALVTAALYLAKKVIDQFKNSADDARKTYAKILSSGGQGAGFIVRRQQLSQVLGVGENEVMQYGAAIGYLNQKLDWSSKILTQTNPTLTALGWKFKVLEQDSMALAATITNSLTPAISKIIDGFDKMVKGANGLAADLIDWPKKILDAQRFVNSPGGMNGAGHETHDDKTQSIKFVRLDGSDFTDKMQESLQKRFAKFNGQFASDKAPQVPTSLNRMPASTWEKMGLVIGSSGGQKHLMKIERNTKVTADALLKLVGSLPSNMMRSSNGPSIAYPQP